METHWKCLFEECEAEGTEDDVDAATEAFVAHHTESHEDAPQRFTLDHVADEAEAKSQVEDALRGQRNSLLSTCDWTQLPDSQLSDAERQAWATYRQALRDLPDSKNLDPADPSWPVPPAASS